MGSCMGRCVPCSENPNTFFSRHVFNNRDNGPDFTNLVEENPCRKFHNNKRSFIFRLFNKRNDLKTSKKPVLELVEGIFNPPTDSYSRLNESQCLPSSSSYNSRDISLQCLDARALMARTTTSTPASSLDLEWEHEGLPASITQDPSVSSWVIFQEENLETDTSTHHANGNNSDWSRVSSADSLEWDNVQNSFHASPLISEVDADTQLLLSEIERLTAEALNETGHNLVS